MNKAFEKFNTVIQNRHTYRMLAIWLAVIIAFVALVSFIGVKAVSKLSVKSAEASVLQKEKTRYSSLISDLDKYETQSMEATATLNNVAAKFGVPMKSEELDEYITSMLVKNGIATSSLSMSELTTAQVTPFNPPASTSASGDTPTPAPIQDNPADVFSNKNPDEQIISEYTVNVEAEGSLKSLYGLMETANEKAGVELISYKWNRSEKVVGSSLQKQTLTLTFKVYVI